MPGSQSASPLNYSVVTQAVKVHYKPMRVRDLVYKKNPLLALMSKYERFGGLNMPIPLRYHDPQRRSATFSTAQGNTSTSGLKQFVLERVRDYSFAYVDGQTIQATKGDNNAFLRYLTMEIDGAMNSIARSLAIAMYGDGSGQIGTISSAPPTATTFTLSNPEASTNFEVGMDLVWALNSASALRPGGPRTITGVNRDTGLITLDVALDPSVVAGDAIFQAGDYTSAGSRLKVGGIEGWVPATAPVAGDNWFGVDRSSDPSRLAGVRVNGIGMPIEEALITAAARVARDGARPDRAFCDYETYAALEKSLGTRIRYDTVKAPDVDIGFTGITLVGPTGEMTVVPDYNCQPNVIYLLQMDTWQLCTLGDAPQFLDLDGQRMLRDAGADAYEVRIGYYGNVGCYAPGWNARIALA